MGLFSDLNTGKKFEFELEEALPKENYLKLSEMPEDAKWLVRSIYRNTKSKYGEHYVILADNMEKGKMHAIYGVNLPMFMNETILKIFDNDDMIDAINNSKCAFCRSDERTTQSGKPYYTVVWIDLD